MRKLITVGAMVLATVVGATGTALAVSATLGNPANDRSSVDSWSDFTIVDTNNSAPFDGYFTAIDYYAERAGTIRFVIVDTNDTVTWVSDEVNVATAGPGTVNLAQPVGVTAGSNLGVYSAGYGVISFDYATSADPADFTNYGSGQPAVGQTLPYVGSSARYYSMSAQISASSPEICKDGGWEQYGYKNQGQCIASVVANENSNK